MKKKNTDPFTRNLIIAFVGVLGGVIASFIAISPSFKNSELPEFDIGKHINQHPDSIIIVEAINKGAKKKRVLSIEIDGFYCHQVANVQRINNSFFWYIYLKNVGLPEIALCDGVHNIRFGFTQQKMGNYHKIYFDRKPPQAYVRFAGKHNNEKNIYGKVIDDEVGDEQEITVNLSFKNQEKLHSIQLPVKYVTGENGRRVFEFEYQIQNFQQYTKNDPEYYKPYFELSIKDKAGNEFRQESTYGSFIAAGVQQFGYRDANIQIEKIEAITELQPKKTNASTMKPSVPDSQPIGNIPKPNHFNPVDPPITLRVVIRTFDYIKLSWNRLPDSLDTKEYNVFRNEERVGTSFDTTFIDRDIVTDSTYNYQISGLGGDGVIYHSNVIKTEKHKPTPSIATNTTNIASTQSNKNTTPSSSSRNKVLMTVTQYTDMLRKKGLYDNERNPTGSIVKHQYVPLNIKGEHVVVDETTGLMWQKNPSISIPRSEADIYIDNLNSQQFAGFNDWRLPTLEESISTVVTDVSGKFPRKTDPVFSFNMVKSGFNIVEDQHTWVKEINTPTLFWMIIWDQGQAIITSSKDAQVRAVRNNR